MLLWHAELKYVLGFLVVLGVEFSISILGLVGWSGGRFAINSFPRPPAGCFDVLLNGTLESNRLKPRG